MPIAPTLSTVETHTGGEPFRIVTGGVPAVPGDIEALVRFGREVKAAANLAPRPCTTRFPS